MISIALDGPAGAGKSTVAKGVAKQLGFIYVDTGALYRTVGLKFLRDGYNTELECDIESVLKTIEVNIKFIDGTQHVFLNGEDVSDEIRTPSASMMASAVSAKPPVRAFLLEMQRKLARENNVIMDGRDIGTVILPDADVKIFLTASEECRARRRYEELIAKGKDVKYADVLAEMNQRDAQDAGREIAPATAAPDAVLLDNTGMSFEQSVDAVVSLARKTGRI